MKNRYFLIGIIIFPLLAVSCAPWPPVSVSSSYYLSESFDENIAREMVVISLIGARPDRNVQLWDIEG